MSAFISRNEIEEEEEGNMEWHRNSCERESITEEIFRFLSATRK